MTDDASKPTTEQPEPRSGPRWKWFPLLWVALIAAGATAVQFDLERDPGVRNVIKLAAVAVAALGVAVWGLFISGWPARKRLIVGLLPLLLLYSYSPLGPIKLILDGDMGFMGWQWRWGQRHDELLAAPEASSAIDQWQPTPNDYPRFLGNGYWAEVAGVELETDWQAHPPEELWRKEIGAGWSAFAIVGNYAITQEQRGPDELVTCYEITTGDIIWSHADPVRWDPTGGGALGYAGPRATPTIHEGKVMVQGATGILNCLDAQTGSVLWSHNTMEKHQAEIVTWGKSCSPLVVDNMVVVSVGGKEDQSVVAYDIESGEVVWSSGKYQSSYASPVLAEFAGVRQIVTVDEGFVTARRADNGLPLWQTEWPSNSGADGAASQPVPLPGDRVFLSKGYGHGSVLLHVTSSGSADWQVEPVWDGGLKNVMKTKMGNVVIRDGYVYGLDDVNLQCIELETGKKQWKQRRRPKFGHGQIMLIGDTILMLSELGELILIEANPEKYRELASLQVFADSQITWNNPAFSSPYLLVRNAQEAACYKLPIKSLEPTAVAQQKSPAAVATGL